MNSRSPIRCLDSTEHELGSVTGKAIIATDVTGITPVTIRQCDFDRGMHEVEQAKV